MQQKKLVKYLLQMFYFSVVAIAANKSDLCEEGDLNEQEAKDFAKEINAVFKCTSAKSSAGIEVNKRYFNLLKNLCISIIYIYDNYFNYRIYSNLVEINLSTLITKMMKIKKKRKMREKENKQ